MSGQVDSEDLQVDLMMPSSTYGSHIPTTSKATTADTDANVNRWKEDNVEENKAVSGGKSSNATRSCHDLTVFEESEHLVTADDVSSSMFTDSVLTGIEAPEKATILMDCESWRYADEDAESRDADLDSCQSIEENLAASKWGKGRVQALCAWFEMKGRSEYSESPMEEETGEIEKSPVQ